ncbi:DUF937 domain-containing protein [Niabella hibiscisoli]|uniref:DUF937 domain-containing protein n=1 Tax=Niabella hibiscisoli TaxID=1825928 RepID=UPI0021D46E44|nr:DUF937 domain-containing protein [Niabella hibiscisoli]
MSINIVDLVKNYVSPDLISRASALLGESDSGISKALSGLIPSILGGVVAKGTQSETDAGQLLNAAKEANASGLLGNLSSFSVMLICRRRVPVGLIESSVDSQLLLLMRYPVLPE